MCRSIFILILHPHIIRCNRHSLEVKVRLLAYGSFLYKHFRKDFLLVLLQRRFSTWFISPGRWSGSFLRRRNNFIPPTPIFDLFVCSSISVIIIYIYNFRKTDRIDPKQKAFWKPLIWANTSLAFDPSSRFSFLRGVALF